MSKLKEMSLKLLPALLLGLSLTVAGCGAGAGGAPPPPAPEVSPEEPPPAPAEEPAPAPVTALELDTVRAGRFDQGKMWTFEYPPLDYFRATYGFEPDSSWFARARLGALRLPNCSASFVSPNGLVLTNHHCARESVSQVSQSGERLLDLGFYARSLTDERWVEDLHADQLIAIKDVSDEMGSALAGKEGAARDSAREAFSELVSDRLAGELGGDTADIVVEVISLWDGARYSAYVFKRYSDLRLVMAPELDIGFFGGDPDNFTYPRYNLDMSFFRVYDGEGRPLSTPDYFKWSESGVSEGDAVFVIGSPASTSRLQTVAQLEFRRKVLDRATVHFLSSRVAVLQSFLHTYPDEAEELDLRNEILSLQNSEKAYKYIWEGLHNPNYMARRRDAERQFQEAIERDSTLRDKYGGLIGQLAEIQREKEALASELGAFFGLGNPDLTSAPLLRAIFAYPYLTLKNRGAPETLLADLEARLLSIADQPAALQRDLLAARLRDIEANLGPNSDPVSKILGGQSAADVAQQIVERTALVDSVSTARALDAGSLDTDDPAVQLFSLLIDRIRAYQFTFQDLSQQESDLVSALGRARFDVYGSTIPPDATFSPRIADGVVKGYEYNGTLAPIYTTFYGLYDRYYSFARSEPWGLPTRWLNPPATFDLSKPLNFVFTADVIGGNSGSPVINSDQVIVGVVFDGNIESLPGDFIYDPERNRSVAVDVRGILEALDEIYDADRVVLELVSGQLVASEAEADRVMAARRSRD